MKKNSNTKRAAAFIVVLIFLGRPSMLSAKDIYVDANRVMILIPGPWISRFRVYSRPQMPWLRAMSALSEQEFTEKPWLLQPISLPYAIMKMSMSSSPAWMW